MKLSELEAAARAATPGPWKQRRSTVEIEMGPSCSASCYAGSNANAAHIANCSPETILKLIEVVRAAKEHMEAMSVLVASFTEASRDKAVATEVALREALKGIE